MTIFERTEAQSIIFENTRTLGAEVRGPVGTSQIRAGQTLISAGALHSPALLLRAGIGPATDLQSLGIAVRCNSPGVGEGLQDHPMCGFGLLLNPSARVATTLRNGNLLTSRWSSGLESCAAQDMKMSVTNRFGLPNVGAHFGTVQFGPFKSYSRGKVTLRTANARDEPWISFNLLSDGRDMARMISATKFAYDVLTSPRLDGLIDVMFAGSFGSLMRSLHVKSRFSELFTRAGAKVLDLGGVVRDLALKFVIDKRFDIHELVNDDGLLEEWIRFGVQGDWHACGTCAMGARSNPLSVVDASARVYGVENLRVADASIMPSIPTANTALTTLMIGEKVADMIIEEN